MQPQPDVSARYTAQSQATWAAVLSRLLSTWRGMKTWHDTDVARFEQTALPLIQAGQRQMASLTATYLEQLYREIESTPSPRVALDFNELTGAALRNGADPVDVYRRPFIETWTALGNGEPLDVATERGATRLQQIAKTDLQLARTHTTRAVLEQQPAVEYYIRVPKGEKTCALCLIASTQRYRKSVLLPIHPGCDCETQTVGASYDPGQVIDEAKLAAIHAAVEAALGTSDRAGRAVDYRKIIVTHQHGEIGPVLGFKGQKFTGPSDITS